MNKTPTKQFEKYIYIGASTLPFLGLGYGIYHGIDYSLFPKDYLPLIGQIIQHPRTSSIYTLCVGIAVVISMYQVFRLHLYISNPKRNVRPTTWKTILIWASSISFFLSLVLYEIQAFFTLQDSITMHYVFYILWILTFDLAIILQDFSFTRIIRRIPKFIFVFDLVFSISSIPFLIAMWFVLFNSYNKTFVSIESVIGYIFNIIITLRPMVINHMMNYTVIFRISGRKKLK